MKKLSFVLMAVLLFFAVVAIEAKTPKECNSGTVSGCSGVKSKEIQCMDESKCPVMISTEASCSSEKAVIASTECEKVVTGSNGVKYIDHTVGVGSALVTSVNVEVKKSSCCSCECCKNCDKCNCKNIKQKNKTGKCTCSCDCCKNCKKCSDEKEMK